MVTRATGTGAAGTDTTGWRYRTTDTYWWGWWSHTGVVDDTGAPGRDTHGGTGAVGPIDDTSVDTGGTTLRDTHLP